MRRLFRLFLLLLPVLLLVLAEGALVLAGKGEKRRFFVPVAAGERVRLEPTADSPWGDVRKVFQHVEIIRPKPAGTVRIFCVGASTVRGYPFHPHVTFPRWLEVRLEALFPDQAFEVVNLGSNGRSAHALAQLVDEILDYEPDAVLLYTGHNELLRWNLPRVRHPWRARARDLVERLRLGRLALARLDGGGADGPAEVESAGQESGEQASDDGAAEVEGAARDEDERPMGGAFVPDTTLGATDRQVAEQQFEQSLRRIVRQCRERGVPVVVSDVVLNLRSFPPASSLFDEDDPAGSEARSLEQQARTILSAGRSSRAFPLEYVPLGELPAAALDEAGRLLERAMQLAPMTAAFEFLRARVLEAQGEEEAARGAYLRAADLDLHPARLAWKFNNLVIERVAASEEVTHVDPLPAFQREAPLGIPGAESFVDECHPDFDGLWVLADHFLEGLREAGVPAPANRWPEETEPDRAEYARRLGLEEQGPALAAGYSRVALELIVNSSRRGVRVHPMALRAFDTALELDPRCPEARLGEALLELAWHEADASADDLAEILAENPSLVELVARLAAVHEEWAERLQPFLAGRGDGQ